MLELNYLRSHFDEAVERLSRRNITGKPLLTEVLQIDDQRKSIQKQTDDVLSRSNQLSKEIGVLYKEGKKEAAEKAREESTQLKKTAKELEERLGQVENELQKKLIDLPNLPYKTVPAGKGDHENEIVCQNGQLPALGSGIKPHWELTEQYDIIDFELGSKITGAGFPVYKGKGAKLQRALINFFLDQAEQEGYREIQPPILINEATGYGTGQLPDKEGQMYHTELDSLYLIPTAEVPVTNLYRDVILKEEDFPIKMTAYTPCFRREAGSYGKDVRGLNRLHQFDKVEIVQIEHPERSYETLENMRAYVEGLIRKLELPYRVLKLCGGDLGFASAFTYDMEVYSAGQDKWLEVSSVSNFESFQANRMKLRFKDSASGKNSPAHTLNGSALALPRIVAALLENNQTPSGIKIPEVLRPYTGFDKID